MIFWGVLIVLILFAIYASIPYIIQKRFTVKKREGNTTIQDLQVWLLRNKTLSSILQNTAKSLNKANGYSYEKNLFYASLIMLGFVVFSGVSVVFSFTLAQLWYLGVIYALAVIVIVYIVFKSFLSGLDNKFSENMPSTFKYLSAKYSIDQDILNALKLAAEDSYPPIKKLLFETYDVLQKVNKQEMELDLLEMEARYDNQYATVLLALTKYANSKGGDDSILQQLDELTEDVYFDTDNGKDISSAARSYMVMGVILIPPSLKGFEWISVKMAESGSGSLAEYYVSPDGFVFKIMILLGMIGYVGLLRYHEVKKVS